MGKKKTARPEPYKSVLFMLPAVAGRDGLREALGEVASGACALLRAALVNGREETRSAAYYLGKDLETLVDAAGAALDGRDVLLSEVEELTIDAPDRAVELAWLLRIEEDNDCHPSYGVAAARDAIAKRLQAMIRSMDQPQPEARV